MSHLFLRRIAFTALLVFIFGAIFFAAQAYRADQPGIGTAQHETNEESVRRIVRELLREKPEIVGEALRALMAREQLAETEKQQMNLKARAAEIFDDPGSPVSGNPEGNVTIAEFYDYNCPYCKKSHADLMAMISEDGNIRFVHKEYPILGPGSLFAAKAALAARKQEKYEVFQSALMDYPGKLDDWSVMDVAADAGLNVSQLEKDMEDPLLDADLARIRALAKSLGIDGTPAYIINDRLIPGAVPIKSIQEIVAELRNGNDDKG
ncbi:MAG: DsbA family protein [Rhodospirillaceae bacterium]|jgi:protein-disulfide isomerase|nr:DsbA family protein [Rhodospirillaceae bacterium]MBT5374923.1 DsbA family protein [Rhodospirillaceae bacterium]MBT5658650.1 DsbA family protein [Rhodospirillaceae bacterium]MBT5752212.1 DsbA family protein [Rhodospirillaceae bacterium]